MSTHKIRIKKRTVKKASARPPKKTAPRAPAKKTAAKKSAAKKSGVKKVANPGPARAMNADTGFIDGSDQDIIARALMEGGASRADIAAKVGKKVDSTTRNGTPKPVVNLVAGVLNKLRARGYRVEETFRVLPPTPASKRAATRRANAKK